MRYFGIFLILIGFAVILSANAYAMPPFNSQEIYDFSNVIAVGKVISVNSTFSPIHNLYEIKVEKFLKNQQDSDVLFAAGQKIINIRLGNQVFDVNDRGLFYLTNNTIGYDPYSGIFLVYPTSQLIESEWDKCNIFDKEISREHWVFGGTGQMPAVRQGNNTDIENFAIGKQVLVSYDIFNHLPDAKNVTFGIMIKKIDEPDYLYTETNSHLLEPCVPYKTLTWTFTPTKSGQYAAEIYDAGSQMGVGFTAKSLPLCTSDRTACFQDEYICDPAGWECVDTKNIFNTVIDSPLKQIKAGIALVDVQCSDEKYPAIRHDRMRVACVSLDTESKLVMRGWATMRLAMPGDNVSEALCNNYKGKWHKEYNGCRDISDLQCSLIGGKFVDDLKICENGICPDQGYEICVTESENGSLKISESQPTQSSDVGLQVDVTGQQQVRWGTTHDITVDVTRNGNPVSDSLVIITIEDYGKDIIRKFEGQTNDSGRFVFSWEIPKSFDDIETLLAYVDVTDDISAKTVLFKFQVYCLPGESGCKVEGN